MDPGTDEFARVHHFRDLVRGDPGRVPLDRSALALAAVLRARVDEDEALTVLDELAAGCPTPTFDGLRRHLYEHLAFQGDHQQYDDPRNSFLDIVLARRSGLPILLATVMIEVGRRVGVPVAGVGMPLHFLVRDAADENAFVDPFDGRRLDAAGARSRFEELAQGRLPWSERHLRPVPARHMLIRMLTNLRASYERRRDPVRLALVAHLRLAIPELEQEANAAARSGAVFN